MLNKDVTLYAKWTRYGFLQYGDGAYIDPTSSWATHSYYATPLGTSLYDFKGEFKENRSTTSTGTTLTNLQGYPIDKFSSSILAADKTSIAPYETARLNIKDSTDVQLACAKRGCIPGFLVKNSSGAVVTSTKGNLYQVSPTVSISNSR